MKRLLRVLLRLVAVVLLLAVAAAVYAVLSVDRRIGAVHAVTVPSVPALSGPEAVERGRYLVTNVAACIDCHDRDFGGRVLVDSPLMGTLAGANLTRGQGGIGARYADEDFIRALTHGVRRDGRSVVYMPSQQYHFGADDLGAIVAFLRSLPPVDRELPAPRVGVVAAVMTAFGDMKLLPAEHIDHAGFALPASELAADPVKAGEQLVAKAGCRACHGPHFEGGFGPPPGAANLTPVGIGGWTEADFFAALRHGVRPNGTKLADAMPRTLGEMADGDLKRIFAYLQTLKPAGTKTKRQS